MSAPASLESSQAVHNPLAARFQRVRARTLALTAGLTAEDQMVQTMADVSPTKWHLAHVTWFFEEFVLKPWARGYTPFDPAFGYLFNSYYNGVGRMHPRPQRGLLSRPGLDRVLAYRAHVDAGVDALLADTPSAEVLDLVLLGTHHEQQHQELLLTDIKHVLAANPLQPALREARREPVTGSAPPQRFIRGKEGVCTLGHVGDGFHFDNETPHHRVFLEPHEIANRPVSNGEYRAFILDGGYRRPELWLSDGWATVQARDWDRPLYWQEDLETCFTLAGPQPIDHEAPVCHVSYYEADAFARWASARLPLEGELEQIALDTPITGTLQDTDRFHPGRAATAQDGFLQIWGDVWEWTASPYSAYPGFRPPAGAVGEYNGKFMCNQMVLRGGSCATPADHLRPSYRNFFYPDARWQFTGIRLARDTTTSHKEPQ